jgi:hypothetical protein
MAINLQGSINWDFNNKHVQPPSSIRDTGITVQANTILIAAGPPTFKQGAGEANAKQSGFKKILSKAGVTKSNFAESLYPIGVAESIAVGQGKALQMFFEIGSKRRYFVPGRVQNSLNLQRVYMDGPSLLKVMWSYYNGATDTDPSNKGMAAWRNGQDVPVMSPGVGPLWLNLASDLFDRPMGLLLYFQNSAKEEVGAVYLENCNIASHQFAVSASSTLFSEAVSLQFDAIVPVPIF